MDFKLASPIPQLPDEASRAERTRHALILAGLAVLEEVGPEKLSLRQVAKQASVSPMASYRYFDSKEKLLAELARLGFVALGSSIRAHAPNDLAELDTATFREMCLAYAAFAHAHGTVYQLMFSGVIPDHRPHKDLMRDAKWSFEIVIDGARSLKQRGLFKSSPDRYLAYHCWSFIHGYMTLNQDRAMPPEEEIPLLERVAVHIDLMIEGLISSDQRN
jgi:AcrR family transcriptional regulator